ncbi:putative defensin-like protein [Cardamine amara subsp. amara]|uniref:Defensin-like protein n=1 Tax=Cardamine amara subsp. amara TaxID=228776 RepID=A0ABD1AV06_CARAN
MEKTTSLVFFVSFLIMCASVVDQTNAINANKVCEGGAGICTPQCGEDCCEAHCVKKYRGGSGSCNSIGNILLCQCEYPC